jgi:hypothetical protein
VDAPMGTGAQLSSTLIPSISRNPLDALVTGPNAIFVRLGAGLPSARCIGSTRWPRSDRRRSSTTVPWAPPRLCSALPWPSVPRRPFDTHLLGSPPPPRCGDIEDARLHQASTGRRRRLAIERRRRHRCRGRSARGHRLRALAVGSLRPELRRRARSDRPGGVDCAHCSGHSSSPMWSLPCQASLRRGPGRRPFCELNNSSRSVIQRSWEAGATRSLFG